MQRLIIANVAVQPCQRVSLDRPPADFELENNAMRRMMPTLALAGIAALSSFAGTSQAAIVLNELFINPPGTDGGQEFIELRSTTGGTEAMTGLTLLMIEGDGTTPGLIDQALSLNAFSTGTNGLFLWRDATSTIDTSSAAGVQGPATATNIVVADFNPDIENGSNTYMIVSGFTGALNNDLDTNDDGVLDVTPWTSIVDAIGLVENDGSANVSYAGAAGTFGPNGAFNADVLARVFDTFNNTWTIVGTDVIGTNPGGPYTFDVPRTALINGATPSLAAFLPEGVATPGVANPTVPEPASLAVVALGALAMVRRRR
jgi:hypothetical protein